MIDDLITEVRFGYLGTSLSPGSNKRIIYLCSSCNKAGSTLRCYYKEGHVCIECARSKRKIGQAAIKEDILRVAKLLGHQPAAQEYEEVGKYSLVTVRANFQQGWREILFSIGLKVQRRPKDPYSFEDVAKDLIAVKTELGFVPTEEQYLKVGKISLNAIKRATNCNTWVDIIEKVLGISREEGNFYQVGNYQTTKQYLEKLNKSDASAEDVAEFRKILEQEPEVAQVFGDLGERAGLKLLEQISSIPLITESAKVYIKQMKDELGWQTSSMLEKLLIETIVNCWLQYNHAMMVLASATKGTHIMKEGKYLEERVSVVHKRYLRSIESLSRVRKLLKTTPSNDLSYDLTAFSNHRNTVME